MKRHPKNEESDFHAETAYPYGAFCHVYYLVVSKKVFAPYSFNTCGMKIFARKTPLFLTKMTTQIVTAIISPVHENTEIMEANLKNFTR